MFRLLHRWVGLFAAILLITISLTGVVLSVFPMLSADRTADRLNAGELVAAVQQNVDGASQVSVDTNGVVTATGFDANGFIEVQIDPATGAVVGPVTSSDVEQWFENLHRSLFLSSTGQMAVLIASGGMLLLTISGYVLAKRRMGGWRMVFSRDRGEGAGSLHLRVARVAGAGIIISAFTGVWMGAATLGLIPDPYPQASFPDQLSSAEALPADQLSALTAIPGDQLRSVLLPREGLSGQAYEVETDAGAGYVDPGTGEMVAFAPRSGWSKAMDLIHLIHTGQGASIIGLILGLMSVPVPFLSATGAIVWLKGRRHGAAAPNAKADAADVIILVGSEGGTTWRFAEAFSRSLDKIGTKAHIAEMNAFKPAQYKKANSIVLFAATYGDGDAPESADTFLDKLETLDKTRDLPMAVLGFGDSTYADFCGFARTVSEKAEARGWRMMHGLHTIDRQSETEYAAWGEAFSLASGLPLEDVTADLERPASQKLRLVKKSLHGESAQAPTAVLRFALPKRSIMDRVLGRGFAKFQPGDILNVLPEGDDRPRSYSLASGVKDGFVEICVRKSPGGLASSQLCALRVGEEIDAYMSANARFHAPKGKAPVILIGAGAGVGALAGMARANPVGREAHMFFGMRSRAGGLPFEAEIEDCLGDGRLNDVTYALSRSDQPRYVQQAVREDAARLRDLIGRGAHIMICGGRDMGAGVREAIEEIIKPLGLTVSGLEAEGRYAADVF